VALDWETSNDFSLEYLLQIATLKAFSI
jgi:hypothetical protein